MIAWLKYLLLYVGSYVRLPRRNGLFQVCPFCHLSDEDETRIVFRDGMNLILLAKYQIADGHLLVIPRRHVSSIRDLSSEELCSLFGRVQAAARALMAAHLADGVNVAINDGQAAGQTVFHVHIHVLPRRTHDLRLPSIWANPELMLSGRTLTNTRAVDLKNRLGALLEN